MRLVNIDDPRIIWTEIVDADGNDITEGLAMDCSLRLVRTDFILKYKEKLERSGDYAGAAALYNLILYWEQEVYHGE